MGHGVKAFGLESGNMFRKILIALVAMVTIGVAGITSAQAWRGGRGYYRGGWGRGRGWGYRGFYRGGYYPAYGYGYGGCWRTVRVVGPYGYGWRRVWVCG
jgi:hypothetical protein